MLPVMLSTILIVFLIVSSMSTIFGLYAIYLIAQDIRYDINDIKLVNKMKK